MSNLIKWELPPPPDRNGHHGGHVGLLSVEADFHCLILAHLGRTNAAIRTITGLTDGQIYYRLTKMDARRARKDFRDGKSPLAVLAFEKLKGADAKHVQREVRALEAREDAS